MIEVLHIEDCANWEEVGRRVRNALAALGDISASVRFRLVQTQDDAAAMTFAGSPTITVDGVDLFPIAEPPAALACRVYMTPAGSAGLPTQDQLMEALRARGC